MPGDIGCKNCQKWIPILKEGSPGMPQHIARPGWGQCINIDITMVRMRGFMETNEKFFCRCFQPLPTKESHAVPDR